MHLINIARPICVRSSNSKRDAEETDVLLASTSRGGSEADSISSKVVDSEVLAEEDVTWKGMKTVVGRQERGVRTNNPEVSAGEVDVHTSESANAGTAGVKDVVRTLEGVRLAAEIEGELRQGGDLVTRNGVLAVPRALGTDPAQYVRQNKDKYGKKYSLRVEHLSDGGGHDEEGSAGVDGGASVLELELIITKPNLLKLNLPVGLPADGDVGDAAFVVSWVDTTENGFATVIF